MDNYHPEQPKNPGTSSPAQTVLTFPTPNTVAKLCVQLRALRVKAVVFAFAVAFVSVFLLLTTAAHAQGCAQCLDSTRATPPAVQAAYRHAIYLLAGSASTIFLTGIFLLRRKA